MQRGEVDMCIVGTDRTIATGDVANKIGTYLKALAAKDNNVPFYVALPSSTIDWETTDLKKIPIEERDSKELSYIEGLDENNNVKKVLIYPKKSKTMNLAFDVTPAQYVTGLITEKGVCEASKEGLKKLFKWKKIGINSKKNYMTKKAFPKSKLSRKNWINLGEKENLLCLHR